MSSSQARLGSPLVYAAVGASILAIPATAAALDSSPSPNNSGSSVKMRVKRRRIDFGREVVAVGSAPSSSHGQSIALEFLPSGSGDWRQIASARISSGGHFRLAAPLNRSGWLKATITAPSPGVGGGGPIASSSSTSSSIPEHVAVAAAVHVRQRAINELAPRTIDVRGMVLPRVGGRRVVLQGDASGRWLTLSSGLTSRRGTFSLRYRPRDPETGRLRIRYAGDASNASATRPAGSLSVYRPEVASWYYDAGTTGCGFHAYYGVANVSLPCGTRVRFFYGGRTVDAVVDDRGPYVGGRTWDLNQNTAGALGFAGVRTVWSSR